MQGQAGTQDEADRLHTAQVVRIGTDRQHTAAASFARETDQRCGVVVRDLRLRMCKEPRPTKRGGLFGRVTTVPTAVPLLALGEARYEVVLQVCVSSTCDSTRGSTCGSTGQPVAVHDGRYGFGGGQSGTSQRR